jgi:hypothetical protein
MYLIDQSIFDRVKLVKELYKLALINGNKTPARNYFRDLNK